MVSVPKKWLLAGILLIGGWISLKYLLPVLLPFLFGWGLALLSEPLVGFCTRNLRFSRPLASTVGVAVCLLFLVGLISLVGAFAVKELGAVMGRLPDMEKTASEGLTLMQDWMIGVADRAPEGVRPLLTRTALELSDSSSTALDQLTHKLPGFLTGLIGKITGSALGLATGLLSAFMISIRLPKLRHTLRQKLPPVWQEKYLPALTRIKHALGGWLKAQLKLSAVTWGIVTAGFWILGVPFAPAWALLVAVVDAVPMLGTGLALIPCALVAFLQAQTLRGIGFLILWGAAAGTRLFLEPRILGKQLGLDPLLTLLAFYVGFRFWGIWGMILAPMFTAAGSAVTQKKIEG